MSVRPLLLAAVLVGSAAIASAQTDFTSAITPSFRGAPCTEYGGWEAFTVPYNGPNLPDVAASNSNASLTQLIPGAILTSIGNIYHPSQVQAFRLEDSVAYDLQEVVLQTATFGNPRNQGSFILSFTNGAQQTVVLAPSEFVVLAAMPSANEELYFRWDLGAYSDAILAYRIDWVSSAPNSSLGAIHLDVRMDCPAGVAQCFGDGTTATCPCGNDGAIGNGCANSVTAAGANLAASGLASVGLDTVVLTGTGMPNSSCLYFQGTHSVRVAFGDGFRCTGGQVIRLGTTVNSAGASQYPNALQQSLSVRGAVAPGDVRIYQAWYRNAAAFCTASTFNLSNAYQITWAP